jgi:hypothetical protein
MSLTFVGTVFGTFCGIFDVFLMFFSESFFYGLFDAFVLILGRFIEAEREKHRCRFSDDFLEAFRHVFLEISVMCKVEKVRFICVFSIEMEVTLLLARSLWDGLSVLF